MLDILVTGADGQLGRELRRLGAASPDRYVFTDVAELDITDREAVCRRVRDEHADIIVNCAAYTNVDRAEEDEATARRINRDAVANLAYAARECGATLVHVSTDYVFGGGGNTPRTEQTPTEPLGVYGRTKLEGEEAILASGCRYLIFRTAWLYSEYGNNFLKTMLRLTAERETLDVVFDQVVAHLCGRPGAGHLQRDRERAACRQRGHLPLRERGRVLVVRLRGGDRRSRGTRRVPHQPLP